MEINCSFAYIDWCCGVKKPFAKLYTCKVTALEIVQPHTIVKKFVGAHLNGKSDKDVEGLIFKEATVKHFPRGVHKIFLHLRGFGIEGCGLTEIFHNDLVGLETLEILSIRGNDELKLLPSNLFLNMTKLRVISFRSNRIKFLSSKILKPIMNNRLCWISFVNNESIDYVYSPDYSNTSIAQLMTNIDEKCVKPSGEQNQHNASVEFTESFMSYVTHLRTSGKLSDFTIVTASKKFNVHKFVLATRSEFFAEMFDKQSDVRELNIRDLSEGVVEELLRYLYTGKIDDDTDFNELFRLSSKLEILTLKAICIDKLLCGLQESNAYDLLKLGNAYKCDKLKTQAFDEMRRMFSEVKLSDDLMDKPEALRELIDARKFFESIQKKFGEKSSELRASNFVKSSENSI